MRVSTHQSCNRRARRAPQRFCAISPLLAVQAMAQGLGECEPKWHSMDQGFNGGIRHLAVWDPDGPGGQSPLLVAGGLFTHAGGVPASYIAGWNGVQWAPFGLGVGNNVGAMTVWDPDGAGPQPANIVVGGVFSSAGTTSVNNIARWDGSGRSIGLGTGGLNPQVVCLGKWDPDGAGPHPEFLVAGGWFTSAGGLPSNRIAVSLGTFWAPLGSGLNRVVACVTSWDPDGPGPLGPQLIAGGWFERSGSSDMRNIARWDRPSSLWYPFGEGMNDRVYALTTWDPDGPGPLPAMVRGSVHDC